jgi:hypothetical protein
MSKVTDRTGITTMIEAAKPGDKFKVTFKEGSGGNKVDDQMKVVMSYFGLMDGANISIEGMGTLTARAVVSSGKWEGAINRTYQFRIPEEFNTDWFLSRLREGIEVLEKLSVAEPAQA